MILKMYHLKSYGEMVLEVNNTKATLLRLLNSNYEDESMLVNASITFTRFCSSIGDHSDKVISQAVEFVQRNSGARPLLIQSLHQLGEVYYNASNFEKAKDKLQEAEKLCLFDPHANSQLYGLILRNIGDVYELQDALSDAEACYQKSLSIGRIEMTFIWKEFIFKIRKFIQKATEADEAITLYQNAIQCHEEYQCPTSQGENYKGLGWVYLSQNK
jgi:tetratricopeptide (TPR) repeat protein